jgi:transcriptional regulator GlxA family with amidase domain
VVCEDGRRQAGLTQQPLMAEQIRRSVLMGLLLNLPHRYRDRSALAGRPRAVQRVIDAMHDAPERPYTVGELAEIGGVSVRSMQEGFRLHLGTTPMAYLQSVRLHRAHGWLWEGDPQRVTVAAVAHRWGFLHLGRFARTYFDCYGVYPSETLHSG